MPPRREYVQQRALAGDARVVERAVAEHARLTLARGGRWLFGRAPAPRAETCAHIAQHFDGLRE